VQSRSRSLPPPARNYWSSYVTVFGPLHQPRQRCGLRVGLQRHHHGRQPVPVTANTVTPNLNSRAGDRRGRIMARSPTTDNRRWRGAQSVPVHDFSFACVTWGEARTHSAGMYISSGLPPGRIRPHGRRQRAITSSRSSTPVRRAFSWHVATQPWLYLGTTTRRGSIRAFGGRRLDQRDWRRTPVRVVVPLNRPGLSIGLCRSAGVFTTLRVSFLSLKVFTRTRPPAIHTRHWLLSGNYLLPFYYTFRFAQPHSDARGPGVQRDPGLAS